MLISLSGSTQVAPNYWLNWTNGVNYLVGVQTPQYAMPTLDKLMRTPHRRGRSSRQRDHADESDGHGRRPRQPSPAQSSGVGLRQSRRPAAATRNC